ncbi:hypothetical protein LWC34_28355 [Kibdelosporangium philippinense]|uniref:Uncharacterized protein n=1 Tax=Kibdelosporangium philippinense TaxID=211113 RepID=A0ABS8ZGW7_9PSEU|nr:hypothetical protein [Kibdelosporangium philippinense]MCE7006712.1 hypothetical protein [Kibdelosporangium philippinense]
MRILAVLAAIVMTFLISPLVANAGGPTSVLISSPTDQKAAALYYSQSDYGRLMNLVGGQPAADPKAPDNLISGPGAKSVRLTWLVHDVSVWRVDHVFLDLQDGVWVETYMATPDGIKLDPPGVVHRPTDQDNLRKLLYSLLNPAPEATAQVRNAAAEPPAAEGIQWTSLLIGAACGVLIALAARVLLSRRQV